MNQAVTRATFDQVMVQTYQPAGFIPVRGAGSRVWDQDGREFIDFAGGIAVNALGHCHPELQAALAEQAGKLWHISNVFTNEPALRLASKLTELTFADRAFFCNSGAEANEAALKLARKYARDHFGAEKNRIVACDNSFHGRTLFTVSVGGQPKYNQDFAPLPEAIAHAPYNDIEALERLVDAHTCAVILEPVQGEGGVLAADPAFLLRARELCDRHGALLIFDEVQTGVGRTGSLYAYMQTDVVPDILTSAKSLGGGFPIGAMLTRDAIAASFTPGSHGTTYGGNPLACAVALRVLEIVSRPEVLAGIQDRHGRLVAGLSALGDKYGLFKEIRGKGLLLGCELQGKQAGAARVVLHAAEAEGLMLLQAGPNVVRLAPSLLIEHQDIEEGLSRLDRALAHIA
ncbi:aspartate aminotransferase family protein [Paludibacterium purpuratum]|uniref:Acetylornithine aminotransferase n=1 Tax=Paludibacterium purpuratum TaxID=1144873 RepID=A0A4R7BAY7_9NEIS|nr:aspartate aminotransferase family protein [Paludibacterium purpuratum]TDR82031.1 acetylornithine/N-succinyldiaminopimelate aminotransferase [Paludibacterium purpuratum]